MGLETLGVRAIVTVLFGPLILAAAWFGGYFFLLVVAAITMVAMWEFYNLARHKNTQPSIYAGLLTGLIVVWLMFSEQVSSLGFVLTCAFLVMLTIELFRNQPSPILNIAVSLMGIFYIALPFGSLLLIRALPGTDGQAAVPGGLFVILIFLSIWICDSAAYLFGARFGRHKLFVRVSPNKTIEGSLAGFVFALVTAFLFYIFLLKPYLTVYQTLIVGGICGGLGQLSDLVESLFKRDAGVKDTSKLIPGHGGVLDRFDSEVLAAPAVFLYLRYFVF